MNAYLNIVKSIIDKELDNIDSFKLIKFVNFTTPKIYLELCEYYKSNFNLKNIEFIGKLSKEKYVFWKDNINFDYDLNQMDKLGYIEKTEHLTKWRNYSFNEAIGKTVMFLMGTELVEDQGGLEEFFTISPEIIEGHVKHKYSDIFLQGGVNLTDEECEVIDNIYTNIFKYAEKDLLKLSNFVDNSNRTTDFSIYLTHIFDNLFSMWNIPNIKHIFLMIKNTEKLKYGDIDLIENAYKFSRRIGLDSYQTETKVNILAEGIDKYYEQNKNDLDNELDEVLPGYGDYSDFKNDLIDYIKGIRIEEVKEKLSKCDFNIINKVLKFRKKGKNPAKTPKIYGDPFKALFMPILNGINTLDQDQKTSLSKIIIKIEQIKLSNTKSIDNQLLVNKWTNMCRFLGGIEKLIQQLILKNLSGNELEIKIITEDEEDEKVINYYPFDIRNIKRIMDSGILSSSSDSEQKSKINLKIQFYLEDEMDDILDKEYEWNVFDTDSWTSSFDFLDSESFISAMECQSLIPIGYSETVNMLIDSTTEEEFTKINKSTEIEYINVVDKIKHSGEVFYSLTTVGNYFKKFIEEVNSEGLFNTIKGKDLSAISLLSEYNKLNKKVIESIKDKSIDASEVNFIAKSFLILNDKEYYAKDVVGALVPPYHPVMLEKIVERYMYLSNGLEELYIELMNGDEVVENRIVNKFERLEQLSTITFALDVLIGKNNNYIGCNKTYGFYSLYGESKEGYKINGVNVNYNDTDDEEDYKGLLEKTPVSNYISKVISDYINTYPSKIDGLKIAFVEPKDFKNVVSGLNEVIKRIRKCIKYKIKITLYIYTSDYKCKGIGYIRYWIENNFTEEDNVLIEPYMKYIGEQQESTETYEIYLGKNLQMSDIIFIKEVMKSKSIEAEDTNNFPNVEKIIENRYPAVYLPIPTNEIRTRKVAISQPQFQCEYSHAQFMVYVGSSIAKDDKFRLVKHVELTDNNEVLLKVLHEKAAWVIVLDENIDIKLMNLETNKIIGFSTGEGYFGELNTTISSRDYFLTDLEKFLKIRLKNKFNWNINETSIAAKNCMDYAQMLDGAQILKAINPDDEAVNNYLAYILTSKMENIDQIDNEKYYLRKIVNLDAHSHLFTEQMNLNENKKGELRPDFLILEIPTQSNSLDDETSLNINAKIIECKVAKHNDEHINNAKNQVISGYHKLSKVWQSEENNTVQKRFWFNQLYRLLAYNNDYIEEAEIINKYVNKLTLINEGKFSISFSNVIYTYWLDEEYKHGIEKGSYNYEGIEINHINVDKNVIKEILLDTEFGFEGIYKEKQIDKEYNDKSFEQENNKVDNEKEQNEKDINNNDQPDIENEVANDMDAQNETEHNHDKLDNKDEEISIKIKQEVIELFNNMVNKNFENEKEEIENKLKILRAQLETRKIKIYTEDFIIGPDIVRIKIKPGIGVDFSQLEKYTIDMKLWLGINENPYLFIEDGFIKLDMVREYRQTVGIKNVFKKLNSIGSKYKDYKDHFYALLGVDVLGNPYLIDFSDSNSPHLLIAGQTGSGKSVLLTSILTSIIAIYSVNDIEMVLVDPKYVELTSFEDSPFTKKIAVESDEALDLLEGLVNEMNERYKSFKKEKVKDIAGYNKKVVREKRMKRILMVFDEYASMMEESKDNAKRIESAIKDLSQKARAAGIHLIICTQTPRADIITTTIRNNLTARVGLRVADSNASNLILDGKGSESLLGKGDMLFKTASTSNLIRLKSPFVTNEEVESLVKYLNS